MARPIRTLSAILRRFRQREDGYLVVESALILPFLLWAFVALYSYWDGFRAVTQVQKATFVVSDLISREQRTVNDAYINGMRRTIDTMLPGDMESELRVTSIVWVQANNRFEVEWSARSGTLAPLLTTALLSPLVGKIPTMSDGDTAVIVESWVDYDATFVMGGIQDTRMNQFVVTRPRFAPRIVYQ
jgi:Flp pilus assembly protein TadG